MHTPRKRSGVWLLALVATVALNSVSRADFLVSSSNTNQVLRYTDTGTFVGVWAQGGGLSSPQGLAYGPNKDLYVASYANGSILEYDGMTGAFVKTFASSATTAQSVIGLHWGPDGNLYVSEYNSTAGQPAIEKFNGTTGASMGAVVTSGTGGLAGPLDFSFDKTGNLLVSSSGTNQVLKYSPTGTFLGVFIAAGAGGLQFPDGQTHDVAGNLYVSSSFTNQVLKYDVNGNFLGVAAFTGANSSPVGSFIDANGHLLVSANFKDQVQIFDSTGTLLNTTAPGPLVGPTYITAFIPSVVPEPSSFALAGIGLSVVFGLSWPRNRQRAA
jgi:sugar lactone lactonase YvrE